MWCSDCRQDVPGIALKDDVNRIVCARCGSTLSASGSRPAADSIHFEEIPERPASTAKRAVDPAVPVIDLDDWQLEGDLEAAEQLVSALRSSNPPETRIDPTSAAIQATLQQVAHWHAHSRHRIPDPPRGTHRSAPSRRAPKRGWLSWTFLSVGLMTFVCGAVLSGLSFITGHAALWNVGMPLVLTGQAGLLLGLIFQLEGLWQSNYETSESLESLDSQLSDLRHSTTLMTSTHSTAAQSFYAHMAEGASPQLLLADLKGQLDMLAMKMSRET